MLPRGRVEKIIPILKKDARRALRMKVPGFPKPYFCSFLMRDLNWFNTWASSGSTYRLRSDHSRNVFCDIRVGSHRYDQTTEGGLQDNDEELESFSYVSAPIDDTCYDGLRIALWKLSEAKYREALSDYNIKEAARVSTLNPSRKFYSFVPVKPIRKIQGARAERVDEQKWERFCKRISKWISELPEVSSNFVEFESSQETRIYVSTEGSSIVQHSQIFSLSALLRKLTKEGSHIEQELVLHTGSQGELPEMRQFKRELEGCYERLLTLIKARKVPAFSGPVLLYPQPAGLLFHEAIGHRLEGSRLLSPGEGQTFKGQIGERVLNVDLSIRDNPRIKQFKGQRCIGSYDYDDEGVKAEDALLIDRGVLRGFLTTRGAIKARNHHSNGHARNRKHQRPISRMAVTVVEGNQPHTIDELREQLLREIRRQRKPYGMIVYETTGGETDTTSYDFQAFSGEIAYASLIYPDGKEVIVRGVDFVGTPLQALQNIVAVGGEQELDNAYCGAESGMIPVSTISPAVLLSNLELQAKDEELVTQYILSKPRF